MTGSPSDGEIEWIDDAGPAHSPATADVVRTRTPRAPRRPGRPSWNRWNWWYGLVALAILAAIVVAVRPRAPSHPAAGAGASSSSAASPSPSTPAGAAPALTAPSVVPIGRPLLDVPANWELFGRASGSIVRLQLAAGRITVTPIPLLSSDGPTSFVVGPDRAIIRPLDQVPGYVVPDGQPAQLLGSPFPLSGPALPGPDPEHLWVPGNAPDTMALVDFEGKPTGTSLVLPADVGPVESDGAGYFLFNGTAGVYDLRPTGIHRVTTGQLLAVGPTTWLTVECDPAFLCEVTTIDRATGGLHTLAPPIPNFSGGGVISPDGTVAAMLEGDGSKPVSLHLLDLRTGADKATTITLDPNLNYQNTLYVWSPDSHWLFTTNATGRLYATDVRTNTTTELGSALGPIGQLALRVGPTGDAGHAND